MTDYYGPCFTCDLHSAEVAILNQRIKDALTYLSGDEGQFDGYALTVEGVAFLIRILEGLTDERDQ